MSSLEALTGTGVYAKELGGVSAAPSSFVEATVATTPTAVDEEVMVLVGAEGSQLQAGPCRWAPRVIPGGLLFPVRGDSCLVVTGDRGHRAIVWWKPQAVAVSPLPTSLPVAPVDGQRIDFLASAAAGVIWPLRYRAGSASPYKWEVVGTPPPLNSVAAGTVTTALGTFVALGGGPSITVPLAGEYDAEYAVQFNGGGLPVAAPKFGTAGAVTDDESVLARYSSSFEQSPSRRTRGTVPAAGQAITLNYREGSGAGTSSFFRRTLFVTPVRVG